MRKIACRSIAVALILSASAAAAEDYGQKIQSAKRGSTVVLPAGTISLGNVALPEGVSLKGAGHGKTIIDAAGSDVGLILRGKAEAAITDLTIMGAAQIGIAIDGATGIAIERVAVRKCPGAVVVRDAADCSIRNAIIADCRSGVSFIRAKGCSLANATLANLEGTAIAVNACENVAVFNNLIANASFGVNVGEGNKGVTIDHNVYICQFVGHVPGHPVRKKVESWRSLSGYDKHSLTIPVAFADAASGDFRPVSPMPWRPDRATTSDWGVDELAGVKAPKTDIDGKPRHGGVDCGAFETRLSALRPADGKFAVESGSGVTSAGLFTTNGRCVRYLFQNLPLAEGKYEFWLPSRDWQGRTIPAGEYDLKIAESDLSLQYIAAAGNGDLESSMHLPGSIPKRASVDPHAVAFDADDNLFLAQSGFENGLHVRCYGPEMKSVKWFINGGGNTVGMAVGGSRLYVMRAPGSLLRLNVASGKGINFKNGGYEKSYPDAFGEIGGICVLGDRLYVADRKAGKLFFLSGDDLDVAGSVAVAAPSQPAADPANKLVWLISGGKELVAVDEQGQVKHKAEPVAQPKLLSISGRRMALYSAAKNQIMVFDCTNPAELKRTRVLGKGGEGFGKIEPDKFRSPRFIAMNSKGDVAICDSPRTIFLNADGSTKRHHMAIWGQGISWGWFAKDDRAHFFQIGGPFDIALDAKNRRWEPGTRWRYTMDAGAPHFFFNAAGRNFGIYTRAEAGKGTWMSIVRMEDDGTARVLCRYGFGKEGLVIQRDPDGDGVIGDAEPSEPVIGSDGKPFSVNIFDRSFWNVDYRPDGSLVIPRRPGLLIIPMTGLDPKGVPQYGFASARTIPGTVDSDPPSTGKPEFISPYDFTTKEKISIAEDMSYFDDGSFTACMTTASGPGPDLCTEHANGTSMAGFDSSGALRWFSPMNPYGLKMGFYGIVTIGGITFAGRGAICEFETMDRDGLGTGVLGTPADFGWGGMWLDNHRQVQGFDAGGKAYLVVGDYAAQAYHWLELQGADQVARRSQRVRIGETLAAALDAAKPEPLPHWPVPPPPRIIVKRLDQPLPVDGDVEKWRKLGVRPIVITPDAASVCDPAGHSAIVRMAWHGEEIYVQAIKFDDTLTFHQREPGKHYLQDGIEMAINTFMEGWKFNVTRLAGTGDVVFRDRWGGGTLMSKEQAPCVIKLLDKAAPLADRKMIEASYGVDMSTSKAAIIEFKLTKAALDGMMGNWKVEFASGKSVLLGIMINDNDTPGSDTLNPITWPVTYGTFERQEKHAVAVLE